MKASELMAILLYFHPIFKGILPSKYYEHFRLLSSAIYLLLLPEITPENLKLADYKLQTFVEQFELYYGRINMTMNVHALTHVSQIVKNLGPIWCYSMFAFESYNGKLKKMVKSSNDVLSQITTKYVIEKNAAMKNITQTKAESVESNISNAFDEELKIEPTEQEKQAMLQVNIKLNENTRYFASMKRSTGIFTSTLYTRAKKTADYFVRFGDNKIGKVKYYISNSNLKHALIEEYVVEQKNDHIFEIIPRNQLFVCKAEVILEKFIYFFSLKKEFIVLRPNHFECN